MIACRRGRPGRWRRSVWRYIPDRSSRRSTPRVSTSKARTARSSGIGRGPKIWAAGVSASPLAKTLAAASGAKLDRAGRIKVEPDCSLPGHPEVFAVGDMMNFDDLPGVAEVALQSGIHAAKTIRRRLDGKAPQPFKYRDLGSMAAVSRRRAVVSLHGIRLTGFLGLADVAVRPPRLPHRLQEPLQDSRRLGPQFPRH